MHSNRPSQASGDSIIHASPQLLTTKGLPAQYINLLVLRKDNEQHGHLITLFRKETMVYNMVMEKVLVPLQKSGAKVPSGVPSVQEKKWSMRIRKKYQQSLRPIPELCDFLIDLVW